MRFALQKQIAVLLGFVRQLNRSFFLMATRCLGGKKNRTKHVLASTSWRESCILPTVKCRRLPRRSYDGQQGCDFRTLQGGNISAGIFPFSSSSNHPWLCYVICTAYHTLSNGLSSMHRIIFYFFCMFNLCFQLYSFILLPLVFFKVFFLRMLCVYWLHIGYWVTILPSNRGDMGMEPFGNVYRYSRVVKM